jgi:hypothetical protein
VLALELQKKYNEICILTIGPFQIKSTDDVKFFLEKFKLQSFFQGLKMRVFEMKREFFYEIKKF